MEHIKKIDFLAPMFSLTIFRNDKYKTLLGALFTFIIIALIITFSFIFGTDFYSRTNPVVNFQNVMSDNNLDILTLDNFLVPWQLTYDNNTPVNYTGILYPKIEYVKALVINDIIQSESESVISLNYTNCPLKYESLFKGISLYNCFNFDSNFSMGGGIDNNSMIYYYRIEFYYCPSLKYASTDGNCTPLEKLESFFDEHVSISIYYPDIHFESDNITDPLHLVFQNSKYSLSQQLFRTDTIYFMKSVVEDDIGIVLKETESSFKYFVNKVDTQYSFSDSSHYYSNLTSSRIYKSEYFLNKNFNRYSRTYMKLQNLVALVGSFITVIEIFIRFIYSFLNIILRDIHIINNFFEFRKSKNEISNIILNKSKFQEKKSKFSEERIINFKVNTFNEEISNKIKRKTNQNEIYVHSKNSFDPKKENENFGLFYVLKKKFFDLICMTFQKNDYEIYNRASEYLIERLDFMNYLKLWEKIQKIQFLLLNKYQSHAFKFCRKLDLNNSIDSMIIDQNKLNSEKIVKYFKDLKNRKQMSEIDKKILGLLDENIRKSIEFD